MTKISGWPGIERSGSTTTRPARSSGTPSERASGDASDAGRPEDGPGGDPVAAHDDAVGRRCRSRRRPSRTSTPSARAPPGPSARAPRERPGGCAARPRRGRCGRRAGRSTGSRTPSTCREISAIAPASSTPVGPPPTRTKVSSARRRPGSVSRSAFSKARRMRRRISSASSSVFEPRRVRLPARRGRSRRGARRPRRSGSRKASRPSASTTSRAAASMPTASARRTRAFACRRRIERIGYAMSPGERAAVATW